MPWTPETTEGSQVLIVNEKASGDLSLSRHGDALVPGRASAESFKIPLLLKTQISGLQ